MRCTAPLSAALLLLAVAAPLPAQQHPNIERGIAPGKAYQVGEIDAVNQYNGNLSLSIPIGPTYNVGGNLSYSLGLTYNSNVWKIDIEQVSWCEYPYQNYNLTVASPDPAANAGLGWRLSLGELRSSGAGVYMSFVYVSPDGAEHPFYRTLHDEETETVGTQYSRDGSYLRLKATNLAGCGDANIYQDATIEFPDGTIHTFHRPYVCSELMLSSMADRFGNALNVTYQTGKWTLQDTQGRTHIVNFSQPVLGQAWMVSSVELQSIGGPRVTYGFSYNWSNPVARSCKHERSPAQCPNLAQLPDIQNIVLLTGVTLPDGSSWSMMNGTTPAYNLDASSRCSELYFPQDQPGTLTRLTAPTGGRFEWAYLDWANPTGSSSCYSDADEHSIVKTSTGVTTKKLYDASGGLVGTWNYTHATWTIPDGPDPDTDPDPDPDSQESWTIVKTPDPEADETKHYFRTRYCLGLSPQEGWDFGLPFTRGRYGADASPYKSVEYYDGTVASGTLKRTSYLTYAHDTLSTPGGLLPLPSVWYASNRRVDFNKTVFADDGNRYAATTYSSYDGLSHYRTATTSGTFGLGDVRTTTTNYNPSAGTYPGSFTLPSTSSPWIISTYDYQTQSEGGVTAKQEYCFETGTGFLQRTRTLKTGTARGTNDLLSYSWRDTSGNLTREQYYGGDAQSINTAALCSLTYPGSDVYSLDHGYQYGTRNTTTYEQSGGTPYTFKILDCDVDLSTGMYTACRDTAGIQTNYSYDSMGRLTWEKPETGHGAWAHNQYLKYGTCSGPAKVETCTKPNGTLTECVDAAASCNPLSDSLTRSAFHFDYLGRLSGEFTKYTSSLWNQRLTTYNAQGWTTSASEWQPSGTSGGAIKATIYSGFDPFGRPTTISPPDGSTHNITLSYTGIRRTSRTVKIATTVGTESDAITTEEYDRQGRLAKLEEYSDPANPTTAVVTSYTYDVGNRLKQVAGTAGSTQNRYFTYDNRGFLTSEQLPEVGPTINGNGTITYSNYDARGHALRKYDGQNYLKFEFDRAERLFKVRESNSGWSDVRVLRQFDYATANNGTDKRNGKLYQATATNMISTTAFPVVETYTYAGLGGRVSRRQTTVDSRTINLDLTWTDLGRLSSVTYPDDTDPLVNDPARTVSDTYAWGLLTAVPSYATSITYHPNLMVNELQQANATKVIYGKDANDMRRPASITLQRTSDSTILWQTGTYAYDGAGNVKAIGSESYLYDKVNRLTSGTIVSGGSKTQTASYTPFGFMTNLTTNGSGQSFSEVSGTNRISGSTYNAAGSLTAWSGYTYGWDVLNQMASVSGGTMTKRTYLYTADGERVEERVGSDPLSPTSSVIAARGVDGKVLRLFTRSGTWSWTKDYVYREGSQIASVDGSGTRHFHLDHLGTIRRITNTATPPAIVGTHDYYPFGYEATDPCQDTERMKYTGHERDQQGTCSTQTDDLDYMHARFESPIIARFMSADPVRGNPKRPQSFNLFAYVTNNPLNSTDPLGLLEEPAEPKQGGSVQMKSDGKCSAYQKGDPDCPPQAQPPAPRPLPTPTQLAPSAGPAVANKTDVSLGVTVQGAYQVRLGKIGKRLTPLQLGGDLTLAVDKGTLSLNVVVQPGLGSGFIAGGFVTFDTSKGATSSAIGGSGFVGAGWAGGLTVLNYGGSDQSVQFVGGYGQGVAGRAFVVTVPVVSKEWKLW